ncbi:glutaminyl-peptide cyclotransferase [Eremococcus coleocola]|uniref:glutaminyl-peptide cyclotransferase n=1 Tax=Eremococcus coleocola TaxID=88132 RepID=UPI00040BB31B|nr:glutaminyl-peptide cyclotransferase [Eremococcus coleocola]
MGKTLRNLILFGVTTFLVSLVRTSQVQASKIKVLESLPFNKTAFTQGLELVDPDTLLLGTGRYGQSRIELYDIKTGQGQQRQLLDEDYFGEGVTVTDDYIYQLTWKKGIAYQRDKESLAVLKEISYEGQGWGLAFDPAQTIIYMSNGSDQIQVRDGDFNLIDQFQVTDQGFPLEMLNELEFANGYLYANVWQTNRIVVIDISTGQVVNDYDFTKIIQQNFTETEQANMDVLNGIAHIEGNIFYITGKNYPKLLKVSLD